MMVPLELRRAADCLGGCLAARRTVHRVWDGPAEQSETTEEASSAFSVGPDGVRYAATVGCGSRAVLAAARRLGADAPDESGGPADSLVDAVAEPQAAPLDAALALVDVPDGRELRLAMHTVRDSSFLVPAGAPASMEHQTRAALTVDVLADGVPVVDADLTWTRRAPDAVDVGAVLARALAAAAASRDVEDRPVRLLLAPPAAALFLHEAVGHLLEHRADRPSPVAGQLGEPLTCASLTVADDPGTGFGRYGRTALGLPSRRRLLLDRGRLVGLLQDGPDGPWRAGSARRLPAPRMSTLTATADRQLDRVRADVHVERAGSGQLDHRTGRFRLRVTRARTSAGAWLRPFEVHGNVLEILAGIRPAAGYGTWAAYCRGTSGVVPVGGRAPGLLLPLLEPVVG